MNERLFVIGSCILTLGIFLYGLAWIITVEIGNYLEPIYYQMPCFVMAFSGFIILISMFMKEKPSIG